MEKHKWFQVFAFGNHWSLLTTKEYYHWLVEPAEWRFWGSCGSWWSETSFQQCLSLLRSWNNSQLTSRSYHGEPLRKSLLKIVQNSVWPVPLHCNGQFVAVTWLKPVLACLSWTQKSQLKVKVKVKASSSKLLLPFSKGQAHLLLVLNWSWSWS